MILHSEFFLKDFNLFMLGHQFCVQNYYSTPSILFKQKFSIIIIIKSQLSCEVQQGCIAVAECRATHHCHCVHSPAWNVLCWVGANHQCSKLKNKTKNIILSEPEILSHTCPFCKYNLFFQQSCIQSRKYDAS